MYTSIKIYVYIYLPVCIGGIHKEEHDEKKDEEREKSKMSKEINFQSELFAYIKKLYFDPHEEKVLAPPATSKRSIQ